MSFLEILGIAFIVVVVVAVMSLVMAYRAVTRGQVINFSRVKAYFDGLLADGQHLDALVFSTRSRGEFLVFRKVLCEDGELVVCLTEPINESTRNYWKEIAEIITQLDLLVERAPCDFTGEQVDTMHVCFGRDTALADKFVRNVFSDVFEIREGQYLLANLQKSATL